MKKSNNDNQGLKMIFLPRRLENFESADLDSIAFHLEAFMYKLKGDQSEEDYRIFLNNLNSTLEGNEDPDIQRLLALCNDLLEIEDEREQQSIILEITDLRYRILDSLDSLENSVSFFPTVLGLRSDISSLRMNSPSEWSHHCDIIS